MADHTRSASYRRDVDINIGPAARSARPVTSRMQEKQYLNDRLASYYIEKVRLLQSENSRLTREVTNIKAMYEHKLSAVEELLDDTCRERDKLEISIDLLWDDNENLKSKLEKLQAKKRNWRSQRDEWRNGIVKLQEEIERQQKLLIIDCWKCFPTLLRMARRLTNSSFLHL